MAVGYLPFSHYDLGERAPNSLAVLAHRARADEVGNLIALPVLPPRERELVDFAIHDAQQIYGAEYLPAGGRKTRVIEPSTPRLEKKIGDQDAELIRLVEL